jgi:predicted transcriptional regulator
MNRRIMKPHNGKWNASKYKILSTLILMDGPATCAFIAHWTGIPVKSVWKDIWRYHKVHYVRHVGNSRPYRYRITAKGRRFVSLMRVLWLIDAKRLDNELAEHYKKVRQREIEEFRARLDVSNRNIPGE